MRMMIQWNGAGCFVITGKPAQTEVSVVSDPYGDIGLRLPRALNGVMTLVSHDGVLASEVSAVSGPEGAKSFLVEHAGEYEVQGIFVKGIHAPKKDGSLHTLYRVNVEGMTVALLGAIDRPLVDAELDALGDVDVLIVPVGGGDVLSATEASEAVAQIEPRIVIPSHFAMPGLKTTWKPVESFCSEIATKREDLAKLSVKKADLPVEDMQLIVLSKA